MSMLTAVHGWSRGVVRVSHSSPVWLRDTGWGSAPERLCPPSLGHKGQWAASSLDQTRPGLYGLNLAQSQGEQEVIFRFWGPKSCGVSWSGIQSQLCLLWGVTLREFLSILLHPPPPTPAFYLPFHLSCTSTHPLTSICPSICPFQPPTLCSRPWSWGKPGSRA